MVQRSANACAEPAIVLQPAAGGRQEQTFLVAENGGWRIEAACCPPNAR